MSIRQAHERDAAEIAEIWNQIIRETLATFTTEEKDADGLKAVMRDAPQRWWVADTGEVVGFACYFQFRGGPGYAHAFEYTVHLSEAARGRGLGRALLSAVEAAARGDGGHTLYAGVSGANAGGQAFHEAAGFERLAVLPEVGRKWDRWLDLHLYQKFL